MEAVDSYLFPAMWLSWMVYWWVSSRNVKATARHESMVSRLLHIVPLLLAAFLLWANHVPIPILKVRFTPLAAWPFWVGAALTAAGLVFTVWARLHLGRNWSGTVTIKEGHELITSGPYALVRHPIYTGLLIAFAGSALARGELRGILAVALVFLSFWRKLRMEERWMREQFGEAYEGYSRRVSALVPFIL
jgi:protein-S-isoprenylcysteine O-methyltransferase Ste14